MQKKIILRSPSGAPLINRLLTSTAFEAKIAITIYTLLDDLWFKEIM